MFNNSGWMSRIYHHLWGAAPELLEEKIVYQLNQLEVKVDLNPIGGYRGKTGTLIIDHVEHKVFTDWSKEDLKTLAQLTQLILKIHEEAQVNNTLIFARQDNENKQFKLNLVPYPKCNWVEKIQGIIHVIFGTPSLNKQQVEEITQFYQTQFDRNYSIDDFDKGVGIEKQDPFCKNEIIENQKIKNFDFKDRRYHLLYDYRPKGNTAQDPHLLIIPEGDSGHCDGSEVDQKKRLHMLQIAQQAMKIFQSENYSTLLYLERNGSKLQGIHHKSSHVIGIHSFPQNFFEKIRALIRQIYTPALSKQDLKDHMRHYQTYAWDKKEAI